jgi:hypothetical protein
MLQSCVDTDVSRSYARRADGQDPLGDHRPKSWCRSEQARRKVVAQLAHGAAVDENVRRRRMLLRLEQNVECSR